MYVYRLQVSLLKETCVYALSISFQAIVALGTSCGMTNLNNEIEDLKTRPLDPFTPKMENLRGT